MVRKEDFIRGDIKFFSDFLLEPELFRQPVFHGADKELAGMREGSNGLF